MPHIAIISSSIRTGRKSHRVALYFKNYLEANNLATVDILDLKEYNFPLFDERLQYQKSPATETLDFAAKIKSAEGVLIVTPEYNGGYPACLKNAIDLLYEEWHRKPVAIATVSDGIFGGSQVITSFDEDGTPKEKTDIDKRASRFINEMLWCIEAKKRMSDK
jgi:NAD(P)H-dependent FMN reductase